MVLLFVFAGLAMVALAHTAPFPFLLEFLDPDRSVWHVPDDDRPPAVYLTFDDGPNPDVTPALLDTLAAEAAPASPPAPAADPIKGHIKSLLSR